MRDIKGMDRDTFWTAVLNYTLKMRSITAALLSQRGIVYHSISYSAQRFLL